MGLCIMHEGWWWWCDYTVFARAVSLAVMVNDVKKGKMQQ